jgi:hypothetical protein
MGAVKYNGTICINPPIFKMNEKSAKAPNMMITK